MEYKTQLIKSIFRFKQAKPKKLNSFSHTLLLHQIAPQKSAVINKLRRVTTDTFKG